MNLNLITLAIDVMGGTKAPNAPLEAAEKMLHTHPHLRYILFGDETIILPLLQKLTLLKEKATLHHTPDVVSDHDKPSASLRQGKNSSMRLAINAVKNKEAQGIISSGNTGALMAHAKIALRTLPKIDRPAIISLIPTHNGHSVMLDLGANVECNADHLFQFALMGSAFAKVIMDCDQPKVALLNIGEEEMKGNEAIRMTAQMLRNSGPLPFHFSGYIEGDNLLEGKVDVIVTDGFTGNVALKTAEGTAKLCANFIKSAFQHSFLTKCAGWIMRPALKTFFKKMDPRGCNGAMLVGLNGIVVKSHGASDEIAFCAAIEVTLKLISYNINEHIEKELIDFQSRIANHPSFIKNTETTMEL